MSTLAGTGAMGSGGDGGFAMDAELAYPTGVAVDSAGNLYVADLIYGRIRKVTADTRVITTVAGNGTLGFSGDGGPATQAQLFDPSAVAVDGDGNLYIADSENNRIRKVDAATGLITTVAGDGTAGSGGDGGPATAAQLNRAFGVAVDAAGNIYISDQLSHRIRKVTAATGTISTVAGTGAGGFSGDGGPGTAAQLYYPYGVAVDGAGNVYVADINNYRVRRISALTGVITTVAGGAGFGSLGDGGPATAAQLSGVVAITFDGPGNMYIADYYANRIRMVQAGTDVISTVAGSGTSGFSGDGGPATAAAMNQPFGVAVDAIGNIYIADEVNNRIRMVSGEITPVVRLEPADRGVFLGVSATFTVATYGVPMPAIIWQVSANGTTWTDLTESGPYSGVRTPTLTITGTPLGLNGLWYRAVATSVAGTVESAPAKLTVSKIMPVITWRRPARIIAGTPLGATQLNATVNVPGSLVYDPPAGTVLAAGNGHPITATFTPTDAATYAVAVRTVTLDVGTDGGPAPGIISTAAGTGTYGSSGDGGAATQAEMSLSIDVVADDAGNLYIADFVSNRIRRVDALTGIITTVAGTGVAGYSGDGGPATLAQVNGALGFALDAAGNLYFADLFSNVVRKVNAATGVISTVSGTGTAGFSGDGGPATAAMMEAPHALAFGPNGDLYIADTGRPRIRRVDALTGFITTIAGTGIDGFSGDGGPATAAQIYYVSDLSFDAAGNLYLADYSNQRIRKIDTAGIITTVAGIGTRGFSGDGGPATAAQLGTPVGVEVDLDGNLYVSDYWNQRIRKVTGATGIITTVAGNQYSAYSGDGGPATEASLRDPEAVAMDGRDFYIADTANNVIRKVTGGIAPAVTAQPADKTVTESGITTFAAVAVGNPAPAVVWQTSTDGNTWYDLAEGPPYGGVATSTLTITSASASLNGRQFRLVATNSLGTAPSGAATLTVTSTQITPVITWANPAAIAVGTPLGTGQLNATASVPGTFAYTPLAGTILPVGQHQTLSVTFTPADAVHYTAATKEVTIDVGVAVGGAAVPSDFNGDLKSDILWRHATLGEVWVWLMDGTAKLSETFVATVPDTDYQIKGVADFDGDGKADILWHHATRGEVWIWPMNGTTRVSETWVATVPDTGYQIAGTGDYNGDGKADILWHHTTRGEVWVWLMDGTTKLSETWIATVPDTGYQIVKVK